MRAAVGSPRGQVVPAARLGFEVDGDDVAAQPRAAVGQDLGVGKKRAGCGVAEHVQLLWRRQDALTPTQIKPKRWQARNASISRRSLNEQAATRSGARNPSPHSAAATLVIRHRVRRR